jgi:hypothetical protein
VEGVGCVPIDRPNQTRKWPGDINAGSGVSPPVRGRQRSERREGSVRRTAPSGIEEAAARDGLSVNAWLVRAVAAALDPEAAGRRSGRRAAPQTGKRYTGWVR